MKATLAKVLTKLLNIDVVTEETNERKKLSEMALETRRMARENDPMSAKVPEPEPAPAPELSDGKANVEETEKATGEMEHAKDLELLDTLSSVDSMGIDVVNASQEQILMLIGAQTNAELQERVQSFAAGDIGGQLHVVAILAYETPAGELCESVRLWHIEDGAANDCIELSLLKYDRKVARDLSLVTISEDCRNVVVCGITTREDKILVATPPILLLWSRGTSGDWSAEPEVLADDSQTKEDSDARPQEIKQCSFVSAPTGVKSKYTVRPSIRGYISKMIIQGFVAVLFQALLDKSNFVSPTQHTACSWYHKFSTIL
eukprot:SAG11_NODE_457_length_9306_cov_2.887803_2_plen_318_part_00